MFITNIHTYTGIHTLIVLVVLLYIVILFTLTGAIIAATGDVDIPFMVCSAVAFLGLLLYTTAIYRQRQNMDAYICTQSLTN